MHARTQSLMVSFLQLWRKVRQPLFRGVLQDSGLIAGHTFTPNKPVKVCRARWDPRSLHEILLSPGGLCPALKLPFSPRECCVWVQQRLLFFGGGSTHLSIGQCAFSGLQGLVKWFWTGSAQRDHWFSKRSCSALNALLLLSVWWRKQNRRCLFLMACIDEL